MPDYVKNLPKAVQDLIFDGVWEERTAEIAKKYSLSDTQADSLINTVLLVMIGLEDPDTFLETIIADLGISRLLAEQINEDLETRVFEYALRTVEKKEEIMSKSKPQISNEVHGLPMSDIGRKKPEPFQIMARTPLGTEPKVPEIKPEILPMIEEDPPSQGFSPLRQSESETSEARGEKVHINRPEAVQRPVEVPRFTGAPIEEEKSTIPVNLPTAPEPLKPEPVKIDHKYVVDPYRENIE